MWLLRVGRDIKLNSLPPSVSCSSPHALTLDGVLAGRDEPRVGRGHLDHAAALGEGVRPAAHLEERRCALHGLLHALRRVRNPVPLERRHEQCEAPAGVRGAHARAVHELLALQRPGRDRADGGPRSRDAHAGVAVRGGPRGGPGVGDPLSVLLQGASHGVALLADAARARRHGVLRLHHGRRHRRRHADEARARPPRGAHGGQGRSVVARGRDEEDPVLVDHLVRELDEAPLVGEGHRFAVGHVDQVHLVAHGLEQRARKARARLHAAQARVADLERHNLRPRGNPVLLGVLGVVGRHDARHVRAVRTRVHADGQHVAAVADRQRVVEVVDVAERAVLLLDAVAVHGLGLRQVPRLRHVHHRAPGGQ